MDGVRKNFELFERLSYACRIMSAWSIPCFSFGHDFSLTEAGGRNSLQNLR